MPWYNSAWSVVISHQDSAEPPCERDSLAAFAAADSWRWGTAFQEICAAILEYLEYEIGPSRREWPTKTEMLKCVSFPSGPSIYSWKATWFRFIAKQIVTLRFLTSGLWLFLQQLSRTPAAVQVPGLKIKPRRGENLSTQMWMKVINDDDRQYTFTGLSIYWILI